jgi:hypothetical protein
MRMILADGSGFRPEGPPRLPPKAIAFVDAETGIEVWVKLDDNGRRALISVLKGEQPVEIASSLPPGAAG